MILLRAACCQRKAAWKRPMLNAARPKTGFLNKDSVAKSSPRKKVARQTSAMNIVAEVLDA